jgi:hypothetical protein
MTNRWGRSEPEWEELVDETFTFLAEQARLRRLTTYTELNAVLANRTGHQAFDLGSDRDRAAMGALLGEVAVAHLPEVGALLSSLVIYLNENDAGPGFYRLAADLELLPDHSSADSRTAFWSRQVQAVHDHFA